jgi:hypothetical protein
VNAEVLSIKKDLVNGAKIFGKAKEIKKVVEKINKAYINKFSQDFSSRNWYDVGLSCLNVFLSSLNMNMQ